MNGLQDWKIYIHTAAPWSPTVNHTESSDPVILKLLKTYRSFRIHNISINACEKRMSALTLTAS